MKSYSTILQGSDAIEDKAVDFALGYDFSQDELEEVTNIDFWYIDTLQGVEIYYHFRADYYFFCPAE
tara:strand:- start:268 stop:468 length:201 start_codon:yes stop_codon:yes gene_type:complete